MTDGLNNEPLFWYSGRGLNNETITVHLHNEQVKLRYSDPHCILKSARPVPKNPPAMMLTQPNLFLVVH